ncbi:MAG: DUF488 domain-containing protein [Oscillospiraceae bacterium]
MLKIKRAYEAPSPEDGFRILVDRLWPRGESKEKEQLDLWEKDIAPTNALRKEFGHDPDKFDWFAQEYRKELDSNPATAEFIRLVGEKLQTSDVTLLYGAKDTRHNQAVVLQSYLEEKLRE